MSIQLITNCNSIHKTNYSYRCWACSHRFSIDLWCWTCSHISFSIYDVWLVRVQPCSSRQHNTSYHSVPGNRYLQVRVRHDPPAWSSLNRLRTGYGGCKSLMQKWGYNEDEQTTWGWTDYATPADLPHPATTVYPWIPVRVQPPS